MAQEPEQACIVLEPEQARIGQELANVIARVDEGYSAVAVNGHSETGVEEEPRGAGSAVEPHQENNLVSVVEALQKKVDELAEIIKLE